jgi:hypothetical protein
MSLISNRDPNEPLTEEQARNAERMIPALANIRGLTRLQNIAERVATLEEGGGGGGGGGPTALSIPLPATDCALKFAGFDFIRFQYALVRVPRECSIRRAELVAATPFTIFEDVPPRYNFGVHVYADAVEDFLAPEQDPQYGFWQNPVTELQIPSDASSVPLLGPDGNGVPKDFPTPVNAFNIPADGHIVVSWTVTGAIGDPFDIDLGAEIGAWGLTLILTLGPPWTEADFPA